MRLTWPFARKWPAGARGIGAAVVGPAAVTLLALFPWHFSIASAALAYVVAVAFATAYGGRGSGLAASLLSFVALHYFFTPPLRRLVDLPGTQDLVALFVFMLVSGVIGMMLSAAYSQRTRAERREQEARLLHHLATRLLSGERTEDVLERFARSVTDLVGLARCEITTEFIQGAIVVEEAGGGANCDRPETFPMVANGRVVGRIRSVSPEDHPLSEDERQVMRMFADQIALALDGVRLAFRMREAQMESESNKARAALFSSVTHDLRTPLASILASATSLRNLKASFGDEDRLELLDAICQEAERLNRLVGNLLDLSRSRAGALRPVKVLAPIDELAEGVLARLEPVLGNHDVSLSIEADLPDVPVDVVQIDQVFTNLLENAAKFTPPGSRIALRATRVDGRLRIETADEGPGIAPQDHARVFEPFVAGQSSQAGGTGLGLAICKAVVEAHGGRIWIADSQGPGTTVVFELPLEEGG